MRIAELFAGLVQHFPTTMLTISLLGGIATGRVAWTVMGAIGAALGFVIFLLQILTQSNTSIAAWFPSTPDIAVLQACSMAPIATRTRYQYTPSIWAAVTTFFLIYILQNAVAIYRAPTTKLPIETSPVQHRKSVGVISILTTLLLLVVLLFARYRTACETPWGYAIGILLGVAGATVFQGINATGSPLLSDVHGVMMGLQPGSLRSHPLACAPRSSATTA
jgi:hypothetical protein